MTSRNKHLRSLLIGIATIGVTSASTVEGQDVVISQDNLEVFTKAYVEMQIIDRTFAICQEIAPDYAGANQAIMDNFSARHSLDQARLLLTSGVEAQPAIKQSLSNPVDKMVTPLTSALQTNDNLCRDGFASMLARVEPHSIEAVMHEFDVKEVIDQESASAASAKSDRAETDDELDDALQDLTNVINTGNVLSTLPY